MAEALRLVKAELGPAAVILQTRTVRRGGILGFGARQIVEVTASNDIQIPPRSKPPAAAPRPDAPPPRPAGNALIQQTYGQIIKAQAAAGQPIIPPSAKGPSPAASTSTIKASASSAASPTISTIPSHARAEDSAVADELREIRRLVTQMAKGQAGQIMPEMPQQLLEQYLTLIEQEVTQELAQEIVLAVRSRLTPQQLTDPATVRAEVARQIASLIPDDPQAGQPARPAPADGRPLTIALVGPTGVGKTTTVAKLAATFKLRHKKRVALITIDTYRIAAVDQLRTYADIIHVPLHVVLTPAEMADALARCRDCDVVIIDTAGRSQRDGHRLGELGQFIDAANPHEVHLVLSSTASPSVLEEAVERFGKIRIDRIIFTKLDEAVTLGVVFNVVRRVNKQLSYVTTGQEVPHQIEPGRGQRLADLILGQGR
jgi:flagellar biosynthesis protein FlhF